MKNKLKAYRFPIILLISIVIGSIIGLIFGEQAEIIKHIGEIFINLLYMVVISIVFYSNASAIASMNSMKRLGKIMGSMRTVFVVTGLIAAIFMLVATVLLTQGTGANIPLETPDNVEDLTLADQLVKTFTVSDFIDLFSRENML